MSLARRLLDTLIYWLSAAVPRQDDIVVFGTWLGKRYADNGRYLFEHLVGARPDLRLVWIGDSAIEPHLVAGDNVNFARIGSLKAALSCARAGTCFVSHGVGDLGFPALRGCRRVYLGHGLAVKIMGSPPNDARGSVLRQLSDLGKLPQTFDFWVASSSDHAKKLTAEHQTQFNSQSRVVELGQPRLDMLHQESRDPRRANDVRSYLRSQHGIPVEARIISYLPTFRDSGEPVFSFSSVSDEIENQLLTASGATDVVIVEKRHAADTSSASSESPDWLVDVGGGRDMDTQDLLLVSDILVTDYSGCYIDFLLLDRPVVHFAYDRYRYENEDRGLYFDLDEVAGGDVVTTTSELIASLNAYLNNPTRHNLLRKDLADRLLAVEEGSSAAVVADYFFP